MGPGKYDQLVQSTGQSRSCNQFHTQMWKRQYDLERARTIPHFSVKEQRQRQKEQDRMMGPGFYRIDSATDYLTKRVASASIMKSKAPRFFDVKRDCFPGPSTYGIPQQHKEEAEARRREASSVGILSRGGKSGRLASPPTFHLGPGLYENSSSVDESLRHQIGNRGIYDCNSLDRSNPIKTGHRAVILSHKLGPGSYDLSTTSAERLNDRDRCIAGRFTRELQYPPKPHQRVFWAEPGNVPVDFCNQVSPASYSLDLSSTTKQSGKASKLTPFGSTDERMNKIAIANFMGQNNPLTGPGRYNRGEREIGATGSEIKWMFNSKVARTNDDKASQILRHRIRTLNIPDTQKSKFDHHATEENIRDIYPNSAPSHSLILA